MKKNAYVEKAQAQLDELSGKIKVLKAKAEGAQASAKIEYEKRIEELNTLKETTMKKLEEIKNSTDDAWEKTKIGFEKSVKSIEEKIKSTISKF
jgi:multidrug resistance efflux pump